MLLLLLKYYNINISSGWSVLPPKNSKLTDDGTTAPIQLRFDSKFIIRDLLVGLILLYTCTYNMIAICFYNCSTGVSLQPSYHLNYSSFIY